MKIMTSLLMVAGISVAQAQIYKCPGKVEGKFTYQERPCQGAKPDEHTLKILFTDEKRRLEAQEKAAREAGRAENNGEKAKTTDTPSTPNNAPASQEPSDSTMNNGEANTNSTTPATATTAEAAVPAKTGSIRPAPVVVNPKPKKNETKSN